ncbi:xanthine dehydrogenase family protein molybdopterin-binding subunit [Segetibacter aerophilus]|uniref:Acylaldehyde oxidase n=1 Tax=Segetibacter aerophilus TaxID=670293 RepID=A0A512BGV1_9BACT|nr:xanthine dehydrogenase family protein molybdopterin-binding subunit [Segetibacter aerophilus]GEO11196.1 acylaldehyde oxidase [Segetibacter aerophilus]
MATHQYLGGQPDEALDRVDGRQKVTGAAKYSVDDILPGLTYAVLVESTIAKGHIKKIDTKKAQSAPGVLAIIYHGNAPAIPGYETGGNPAKPPTGGEPFRVFQNTQIYFAGQPIAIVIADTYERAIYAATLVETEYNKDDQRTDIEGNKDKAVVPKGPRYADYIRGEADAYKNSVIKIEAEYIIPVEVHNPMELHATTAFWDGEDKVTVFDKTQGVKSTQRSIMDAFKLKEQNVQVNTDFVGGGFGSGLRTWPHVIAAVLAAKKINKPVKLVLTRPQMFTMVGYRPYSWQKISLGATRDGVLTGLTHEAISETSTYEEFTDRTVDISKVMYACPNVNTRYKIVALDKSTPTWMRGPGEATGAYALECAIDELSYAVNLDPLELRIRNHADVDPVRNLPWSSKYLKECYQKGAEAIGWNKRNPKPNSMQEGEWQLGYGMGAGNFNANRGRATVKATLLADGSLVLQSAVSDSGPGTATTMTSIASNVFGLSPGKITFELGDSSLPPGPTQGGSTTTSTLGSAVHDVCVALQQKMAELVTIQGSLLQGAKPENLHFEKGYITLKTDASKKVAYADVVKQTGSSQLEVTKDSQAGDERNKYSIYSFAVHFVQVQVHRLTGVVRIKKVVTVADAGKIINEKTAASQLMGGVVSGIGMALMEDAVMDHRFGRYVNNNLADYHVPVSADVPDIKALFIDKPDPFINPIGSKGLGEIANVGFAAAVANAVYHATGKRIRTLPITPDKLLR